MIATASSGFHCSRHASLKVPLLRACCFSPQCTLRARRRCRKTLRARPPSSRRSSSSGLMDAVAFRRRRRIAASISCCSGSAGRSGGSSPKRSPTSSFFLRKSRGNASPWQNTACIACKVSSNPGNGLPRIPAREFESRSASITEAEDASCPSPRRRRAALVSHVGMGSCGFFQRCPYQPGERTPAPYPLENVSRSSVHGIHVAAILCFSNPLRSALSSPTLEVPLSAGACHAPQITAMFWKPSFSAARMHFRIHASRKRVSRDSSIASSPRSSVTASRIASKKSLWSRRSSTRSFHQRSPSL